MENEKHISLRIESELLEKFKYICKYHDRSINGQVINLIKHSIISFEKENGEISTVDDQSK